MTKEIVTGIYDSGANHKSFRAIGSLIDLSRAFNGKLTVYEKIDGLGTSDRIPSDRSNKDFDVWKIENNGSCDYAFIRHIYDNYDNLSDLIIFTKSNLYEGGVEPSGVSTFVAEAEKYDFSDFGAFPIRMIWNLELEYKESKFLEIGYENIDSRRKIYSASSDWFDFIFSEYEKPKTTISVWGHGPLFCVSKELIRRHDKKIYKYLLDTFYDEYHLSKDGYPPKNGEYCPRHDLWNRFYRVLFTHGHEKDGNFNIHQNDHYHIETTHDIVKEGYVIPGRTN